jgi:hypothetical protein
MAEAGQLRVPQPRNEPPLPHRGGGSGGGNASPPAGAAGSGGAGSGDGDGSAGDRNPPVITDIIYPKNRPYSARLYKERTRTWLAFTFSGAFLLTIAFSYAGAILGPHRWAPVRDWLQIMLPAETGLFGSALGFYFGSNAGSTGDD